MKGFLFALVLCAYLSPANAYSVVESTDFPNVISFDPSAVRLGILDAGTNSISGSLAGSCDISRPTPNCNPAGDSQDSFIIEVADGFRLQSIFVTTENVTGPSGFSAAFDLYDINTPLVIFVPAFPLNTTTNDLVATDLGPEEYDITIFGWDSVVSGSYSLDYTVEIGVTAVPAPAAVWLFGSALGILGWMRRKKA